MKVTCLLVMILGLSISVFGQDTTLDQYRKASLADARKTMDAAVGEYDGLVSARAILITKLDGALKDGDKVLIEVALNKLNVNAGTVRVHREIVLEIVGARMMGLANEMFRGGLIDDVVYKNEYLDIFRKAKAKTEEAIPAELAKLVDQAREKLPEYFALLEKIGRPYSL